MKIAGIAIDKWKLSIFEKALGDAGYTYTEHPGLTANTLLLKTEIDGEDLPRLAQVIKFANEKAALFKESQQS